MKNPMLRRLVAWLMIASPIWWTSGCYTMSGMASLNELNTTELQVITRGGNHYTFLRWAADSNGGISGSCVWHIQQKTGGNESTPGMKLTVPSDSIFRSYSDKQIQVLTKGNVTYDFEKWSPDRGNTISGAAKWLNPLYDSGNQLSREFLQGHLVLPLDSIREIGTKEFSAPLTVLAGAGVLTGAAIVFGGVVLAMWALGLPVFGL